MFRSFKLSDYDCVCLDLDNALCRYNISNLLQLQYRLLKKQMVDRGYNEKYFSSTLSAEDIDFIQKGLFMDFEKGNVLYLRADGYILKASHGTSAMDAVQIEREYGKSRRWAVTDSFCVNKLSTWNGPLSDKMRSFLDYTDCQASLVFAQAVDFVDAAKGRPDRYRIWPDLLDGIVAMFSSGGGYAEAITEFPGNYLRKCDPQVIEWMKSLKSAGILLVLITGSGESSASKTAAHCLGSNWKELFDLLIFHACKPAFFSEKRPFVNSKETSQCSELQFGFCKAYNGGNWNAFQDSLAKFCKKSEPRCIYIGDNLIQDVYAPEAYTKCESCAVVEEIAAEGFCPGGHPDKPFLVSKRWGSYLHDNETSSDTVWGDIVKKHSHMCIPFLESFARKPISFEFVPFWPTMVETSV
ncbi:hypothetical protein AAG570_009270 [Ranatra chinensis]|uniref:5'-nucleotidase domain-containing protein 1 n=1 Tax=Ranatra chinensis TaxID=642074 RepID=A0ABD0YTD6_9HEMI